MTFWVNTLFVFIMVLPFFVKGVISTFLVDGVLKYEVKHKLAVYLLLALFGTGIGVFETVVGVSGDVVMIGEIETILMHVVTIIVLAVSIKAKWWKKIIVSLLAVDIIASVDQIFEVLSEQLIDGPDWDSVMTATIMVMLFRILILALEFAFLYSSQYQMLCIIFDFCFLSMIDLLLLSLLLTDCRT